MKLLSIIPPNTFSKLLIPVFKCKNIINQELKFAQKNTYSYSINLKNPNLIGNLEYITQNVNDSDKLNNNSLLLKLDVIAHIQNKQYNIGENLYIIDDLLYNQEKEENNLYKLSCIYLLFINNNIIYKEQFKTNYVNFNKLKLNDNRVNNLIQKLKKELNLQL